MQKASPEKLRELCQGLISGSRTMKKALDENGIDLNEGPAEDENPQKNLPEDFDRELEEKVDEALGEDTLETPPKPEKPAPAADDLDLINSVTHRKEWMAFGRRLAHADASAKYPEVNRLWDGSSVEPWLSWGCQGMDRCYVCSQ